MSPLFIFSIFLSFCFLLLWGYIVSLWRKIKALELREREKMNIEEAFRQAKGETTTLKEELKRMKEALFQEQKESQNAREKQQEAGGIFAIFETIPAGILLLDPQGKIVFINSRAEKMLDITKGEAQGKTLDDLRSFPKMVRLYESLGKASEAFQKDFALEDSVYVSVTSVLLGEQTGHPGTLLLIRDITRERMVERIKTEFVSLAAHQLRTPLSAIKWTLQMMLEGDLGKLTKEQVEIIKKSYRSNERMIHLINSLLEVTRIEEGRYLFEPSLLSLESLVESTLRTFQDEARQKGVRLVFQKPGEKLPKVKADAEKMQLVISNLIDNAIRYTPKGGEVTVSLKYDTKGVECEVRDNGIGIPQNQHARVFERFFRGVNAIRLDTEGTGLGLYISKNIVEAHGGRIWFHSKENEGSTFSFWLPAGKLL